MSYFVTVTFDIQDGDTDDYTNVYTEFYKLGLLHTLKADSGIEVLLPTTTVAGEFNGESQSTVVDYVISKCSKVYESYGLKGEIFAAVGASWAWSHRNI